MNNRVLKTILMITFLFNIFSAVSGQQNNQYDNYKFNESIKFIELNMNTKMTKIDTITKKESIYYKKHVELKNPKTAFLIACIPGFFIHGAGHLYAGHKKEFKILLSTEIICVLGFIIAAFTTPIGPESSGVQGLNDPEYSFLWQFLYFGPWAYDMIAAPIICKRDNEKKIKSLSINPYINKNLFGNQIGLKICYNF